MQFFRLILSLSLIYLLSACAEFSDSQSPAPILGRYPEGYPAYPPVQPPVQPAPEPPPVIVTKPLEGGNQAPAMTEMKPDFPPPQTRAPLPPSTPPMDDFGKVPEGPSDSSLPAESKTDDAVAPESKPDAHSPPPFIDPGSDATVSETPVASAPPARESEVYKPLDSIGPQTPAVGSLVMSANENSQSGNYDSAVSSIERAIRIEPRNAALYYKLAVLRLDQSKPRLAEDIARKAALLAGNNNQLKKHCWLLIANAREQQSNFPGAEKAKSEAAKY